MELERETLTVQRWAVVASLLRLISQTKCTCGSLEVKAESCVESTNFNSKNITVVKGAARSIFVNQQESWFTPESETIRKHSFSASLPCCYQHCSLSSFTVQLARPQLLSRANQPMNPILCQSEI